MQPFRLDVLLAITLAGAIFVPVSAEEARLYLKLYGESAQVSGVARVSSDRDLGSRFDLVDEWGVDPYERAIGLDGFARFGSSRIGFGYSQWKHRSIERFEKPIEFKGRTAPNGTWNSTEQKVRRARLMYGYDFELGKVTLGVLAGIQGVFSKFGVNTVHNQSFHIYNQSESMVWVMPAIGFSVGYHPIEPLSLHMQATGSSYQYHNIKSDMTDVVVAVDWHMTGWAGLTGGYRLYYLDAVWPGTEDDPVFPRKDLLNLKESGWFAGLSLHL